MKQEFISGFVTVIGVPNAGKSSLVNALVCEPVSIVTSKPQTTRKRTLGILTEENSCQIIFVDTPGVIDSNLGLNPFLKKELENALKEVDVIIGAIGPWEFDSEKLPWILRINSQLKSSIIYVATQSDKKLRSRLDILKRWTEWTGSGGPDLYFTSSRSGEGLIDLKKLIVSNLKPGPLYYDLATFTPQSMRDLTAEVIRKYCFEKLHQEIPYGLAVVIQKFEEGSIYKIEADIMVIRDGHKGIVIGQGGKLLKQIGLSSRLELEKMFGKKVYLKLHVVAKPWINNKNLMKELGYASQ